MVYNKEYYEKNKEKIKQQQSEWNKKHREQINKTREKWRHGEGKKLNQISKQKSDAKYHAKRKQDPNYVEQRRLYAEKYNATHKKQHKKSMDKHRAKPEVRKKNARYNSQWTKDNPDKALKNVRNQLNKLSKHHGMNWWTFLKQLRFWASIVHKDCNQVCVNCGKKSTQAHHIFHKSKYPMLAFNRNNGLALCDRCHYEVHGKLLI